MKLSKLFFLPLLALFTISSMSASFPAEKLKAFGGWELLGKKKVNYGLDRDEIMVTAKEGLFSKLHLSVKRAPINLHKLRIHFANGQTQNVEIRKNIAKGGKTRVIDITGGKRVIKKVVMWYDTKNRAKTRAVVQVFGKH
ncbi:MAG: DUF2541 family protein [Saprospiraceae bacterium]|nr:DUF2541 family protein [Saprospiraceae bacterium]